MLHTLYSQMRKRINKIKEWVTLFMVALFNDKLTLLSKGRKYDVFFFSFGDPANQLVSDLILLFKRDKWRRMHVINILLTYL